MLNGERTSEDWARQGWGRKAGDKAKPEARLLIRNIGLLLSGDLRQPILDADTVVAVDGKITAVGKEKDVDGEGATLVIDARGTTLAPGLIDSHVHPVAVDQPRRRELCPWHR